MKKTTKKPAAPASVVVPVAAVTAKAPVAPVAPISVVAPAAPKLSAAPTATTPAPGKAASTPAQTPIVTAAAPITIEAKIDIGFGNKLFVRGQGAGLSWDHGIPLECVDSKTWRLTVPAKDKLQFKLLLNDSIWAQGADVVAAPGKKVEVTPAF